MLYHHGWPGSRLEAALADHPARAAGLRVIAPDRPGYGASTHWPERTLSDWPRDAAVLADHLGIDRFAVVGISGGAPYALACAAALRERVTRVCLVSAMGPVQDRADRARFDRVRRLSLYLAGRSSPLMRGVLRKAVGPLLARHTDGFVGLLAKTCHASDRATLARDDVRAGLAASFREALRSGADGVARDLEIYASPWGFALNEITVPVFLWHGEADQIIPAWLARQLASRLPHVTPRFEPDEGHYSLPVERLETILRELASG